MVPIKSIEHGSEMYWQEVDLRRRVLRAPLGLDFTEEELAAEASDHHLVAIKKGELIGCLVLTPQPGGAMKMRQVAVERAWQGKGVGGRLVHAAEQHAKSLGAQEIVLHARDTALRFYSSLRYELVGEPFSELSIPHFAMRKELR